MIYRLGAAAVVGADPVPILTSDILRVPGTPRGATLRGDEPHPSHTSGRAASGTILLLKTSFPPIILLHVIN